MTGILIDENLPDRLSLATDLVVRHVSSLGGSLGDSEIWSYARRHDFIILSKDADFSHRIGGCEPPPRVVHVRVGNMRLRQILAFIESAWPQIESHFPASKLVNVYPDRIEVVE